MAKSPNPPIAKSEDRLRTPRGTWIYPHFFEKDQVQDKYSGILVVDPADPEFIKFKKEVAAFGKKAFDGDFPKDLSWCIRDGDEWMAAKNKPPQGKLAELISGNSVIIMKSDYPPTASYQKSKGDFPVIEDKKEGDKLIYTGCVGAAQGILAAFNGKYPAVVFWFGSATRLAPGEKIGGVSHDKTFGDMYDDDDDKVGAGPTGSDLDSEIPF